MTRHIYVSIVVGWAFVGACGARTLEKDENRTRATRALPTDAGGSRSNPVEIAGAEGIVTPVPSSSGKPAASSSNDTPTLCPAGDYVCDAEQLIRCELDGTRYLKVESCVSASACDAEKGECRAAGPDDPAVLDDPNAILGVSEFGFPLQDSFMLTPCLGVQAHDCLTMLGTCGKQDPVPFEERGYVFTEHFPLRGDPNKSYDITMSINGIVEAKYYEGGTRRAGQEWNGCGAFHNNDLLYVGGSPIPSSYNVFKVSVFANEDQVKNHTTTLQHIYLNSAPDGTNAESHRTFPIGFSYTFADVPGDAVVQYLTQDSNCRAINNCGIRDDVAPCATSRLVPNEPGLELPQTFGGKDLAELNVVNGRKQPWHAQIVHLTVTEVRESR